MRDGEARTVISTDLRLQAPFVRSDVETLRAALVVKPSPALANMRPIYGESNAFAERSVVQFDVFVGRLTSLGMQAVIWATIGIAFGALARPVLEAGRRAPSPRISAPVR